MKQFGLSHKERIKSTKEFQLVYSAGETLLSSSQKLKAVFFIQKDFEMSEIKTAFAVSRKSGNAVWRNRVKRLLRTAYRLNKHLILSEDKESIGKLLLVFSPYFLNQKKNKVLVLKDILPDVIELIYKVKARI